MANDPWFKKVALLSNFDAAPAGLNVDPYWAYVTLLAHFDGTAGSYTFTDSKAGTTYGYGGNYTSLASGLGYNRSCCGFSQGAGYVYYNGTAGHTFGTGDFTIELRIYPTILAGTIIDWRPANTDGAYPALDLGGDGTLVYHVNTGVSIYSLDAAKVKINAWNHIAVSRVSGVTRVFVNGSLCASAADTTNYLIGSNRPVLGAVGYNVNANRFTGYMEELRITKGVGRYTTSFTPPSRPHNHGAMTTPIQDTLDSAVDTADINLVAYGNATMSPAQSRTGGVSMYLDGTGWVMGGGVDFSNAAFTVEGWFMFPSPVGATAQMLFNLIDSTVAQYVNFYIDADGTPLLLERGSADTLAAWVPGRGVVSANTWHHAAMVRDGNLMCLFLDGALVVAVYATGLVATLNALSIGANAANTSIDRMTGYVDGIRVTNGVARYKASAVDPFLSSVVLALPFATLTRNVPSYASRKAVTNAGVTAVACVTPFGDAGYAAEFNGTSGALSFGASTDFNLGTGDFTIEAWVFITGASTGAVMASAISGWAAGASGFYLNESTFRLAVQAIANPVVSAAHGLSSNAWHHVAVSRAGGVAYLFADGVLKASAACVGTVDFSSSGTFVGRTGWSSTEYFRGRMADLRVTKGVARYTADFAVPTNYALVASGSYVVPTDSFPTAATGVSGVVKESDGSPRSCKVFAYSHATGALLGSATSDPGTGAFYIAAPERCYCVCLDDDVNARNAIVYDRLDPV